MCKQSRPKYTYSKSEVPSGAFLSLGELIAVTLEAFAAGVAKLFLRLLAALPFGRGVPVTRPSSLEQHEYEKKSDPTMEHTLHIHRLYLHFVVLLRRLSCSRSEDVFSL